MMTHKLTKRDYVISCSGNSTWWYTSSECKTLYRYLLVGVILSPIGRDDNIRHELCQSCLNDDSDVFVLC